MTDTRERGVSPQERERLAKEVMRRAEEMAFDHYRAARDGDPDATRHEEVRQRLRDAIASLLRTPCPSENTDVVRQYDEAREAMKSQFPGLFMEHSNAYGTDFVRAADALRESSRG